MDPSGLRWTWRGEALPVIADDAFSEGLAKVHVVIPGASVLRYGFIDRAARMVIAPEFSWAWGFRDGRAAVTVEEDFNALRRKDGVIDRTGAWVLPPRHAFLAGFAEGLAGFCDHEFFSGTRGKDVRHGFVDLHGEVVIPPVFEHACIRFKEGLCAVVRDGRWEYVDRSGTTVIALPTDTKHADEFWGGLAKIQTPRGWHYVQHDGSVAFPGTFRDADRFRNGLASVGFHDGGDGYVDPQGRIVFRARDSCER